MSTNVVSAKQIRRDWHVVSAKDKILGRLAVDIANKLSGKSKTNFVPYLDLGDFVVVTNVGQIKVSGKKSEQKIYARHSGYPGGYKEESFSRLIERRPEEIVRHAVKGMLPKNKLGDKMITRLKLFKEDEHPFNKQIRG